MVEVNQIPADWDAASAFCAPTLDPQLHKRLRSHFAAHRHAGMIEGARLALEAAACDVERYPSIEAADIPIIRGCAIAVRSNNPATIVEKAGD